MDRVSPLTVAAAALIAGCVATPPQWPARREAATDAAPPVFRPPPAAPWTGWDDARPPQIRFDRLRGWSAEPAAIVRFDRVSDAFTGHHPAARLTANTSVGALRVVLRPEQPVGLEAPADTVEAVVAARGTRPTARIALRLRDAAGTLHRADLGPIPAERWTILQAPLPHVFRQCGESGQFGSIEAIEITDWNPAQAPELRLAAITAGPRHPVLLPPPPPEAAAPSPTAAPPPSPSLCTVHRRADGWIEIRSSADDGELSYTLDPATWHRGLAISWNGRLRARWGGWRFEAVMGDPTPRSVVTTADRIEIDTASGARVSVRAAGRTLTMQFRAPRSAGTIVAAGWAAPSPQLLTLPLLEDVPVALWRANAPAEPPLFGTAFFDPFRSSASEMDASRSVLGALGAARYRPADDGRPPAVEETFHLTISPRVEDVLPSVPAMSGRRAADAAMSVYHEPGPLGTGRLREMWDEMQAGPMFVLSEPAVGAPREDELDCTDPRWTREWLRYGADGRWREGSAPGRYAIKTAWMATAQALSAARGEPADRATVVRVGADPPWAFTDYDARTPGAATFRAAMEGLHEWFRLESRRRAAPVLCDAARAWYHADAADAAVWNPARAAELVEQPWRPLMPLLRLNRALGLVGPPVPAAGTEPDHRTLACLIAHGMALRLPPLDIADDRLWRWTFLVAALHRRQALQTVERLAWGTQEGGLCSASAALAGDAWQHSRLYLRYRDGLEIWVNGSVDTWPVTIGGDPVELPAGGWFAIGPDLLAASTLLDGRRFDRVRAPEYAYHDGRGSDRLQDGISSPAPVLVRLEERPRGRCLRLTFLGTPAPVAFGPPFWPRGARLVRLSTVSSIGAPIAPPDAVPEQDRLRVTAPAGAREVELEWTR
ncbi:MAG: hypothetical protein N2652_02495 [Kiritimatiellae bacterium]|nr:hypothetical protein [Kiritimatiellia bacterium]